MRPALAVACAALACAASLGARAAPAPLIAWSFEHADDARDWHHGDLAVPPAVSGGALRFTAGPRDPLVMTPLFRLGTGHYQRVELRLSSDRSGTAELFWAPTTEGKHGGFDQGRSLRFHVAAGGPQEYALYPFWHTDDQIVRLRLDPPDGARIALHALQVTDPAPPEATATTWDFKRDKTLAGWTAAQGLEPLSLTSFGLETHSTTDAPLLLSPRLNIEAAKACWVAVRMRANGYYGEVWAITDQPPGVVRLPFAFSSEPSGGLWRTHNIPLSFGGRLLGIGLVPTHYSGDSPIRIKSIAVGPRPAGPANLSVLHTYLEDPLPRVGRPPDRGCVVTNSGGEPARDLSATVEAPAWIELLSPAEQAGPERLGFGERHAFRWPVVARKPVEGVFEVCLSGTERSSLTPPDGWALVSITPAPEVGTAGYVPRPEPVESAYEVGMYYFPGWNDAGRWAPIRRACFPRPVLGYYREGDPEVADWHIKWAVEHGIDFFIYDWYWVQGETQLMHALHDGYFKARYRHLLKFCLLWANHNPPNTSSEADLLAVTRFWIDNYFRRPEHKTVEGKPLVVIFAPSRLRQDMGSAAVRAAFDKMRALCRESGLPGLYLVACAGRPGELPLLAEEGYDAASAYTYPAAGAEGKRWAPYDTMVTGFEEIWRAMRAQGDLPYLLPVAPGWDNRPWAGDRALVRYGSTPRKFRDMCERARRMMDASQGIESKMLFVEAWNEWGEGAYAEPAGKWRFGYLDALREVFAHAPKEHADLGPRDLGLGPYDVEWPEPQTAWEFDREGDLEGWTASMQIADLEVKGGLLRGRAVGHDPAFFGPPANIDAGRYRRVRIRMRVSQAGTAQLFWSTDAFATSEATSLLFATAADGDFHTYTLEVAANPTWQGTVRSLRLDPSWARGAVAEVDFIRALH